MEIFSENKASPRWNRHRVRPTCIAASIGFHSRGIGWHSPNNRPVYQSSLPIKCQLNLPCSPGAQQEWLVLYSRWTQRGAKLLKSCSYYYYFFNNLHFSSSSFPYKRCIDQRWNLLIFSSTSSQCRFVKFITFCFWSLCNFTANMSDKTSPCVGEMKRELNWRWTYWAAGNDTRNVDE